MSRSHQSVTGSEVASVEAQTASELSSEKIGGEAYVNRSLDEIQTVQDKVTVALELRPNSLKALEATDDALVAIAEHAIEEGENSTGAQAATGNVAIETALELESGRAVTDTPVADLEGDGYSDDVARAVTDLFAHHAVLPSGHEAAPLVARAVEELLSMNPTMTDEPGEVEYISKSLSPVRLIDGDRKGRTKEDVEREFRANETIGRIEALTKMMESTAYQEGVESALDFRDTLARYLESVEWQELLPAQEQQLLYSMCALDARLDSISRDPDLNRCLWMVGTLNQYVPSDVARRMYDAKGADGEDSVLKRYFDTIAVTEARAPALAIALSKVYEDEGGVAQVEEGRDTGIDRLRDFLSETEVAIVSIPERPRDPTNQESVRDFEARIGKSVKEIWINHFQLSKETSKEFGRAAASRMMVEPSEGEGSHYDGKKVRAAMLKIGSIVEAVGAPVVERLHAELGVVNLDNYAPGDLENLRKLLDKDEAYVEHLQDGDVTVLFVDAYGDHNGALGGAFDAYRKPSGRTLMFEVSSPGDFYRRMAQLKGLGVRPSTLVVAAHGSPTLTHFGSPSNGFVLSVGRHVPGNASMVKTKLPLGEARIDRLASDEFMQANRGIDSPPEQIGRREIVVHSCSSDVEYIKGVPSTAEVIARATGRRDVDVFGASDVMYLQSNQEGVRFKGKVKAKGDGGDSYYNIATKVTVGRVAGVFDKLAHFIAQNNISQSYDVPSRLQQFTIKRTRIDRIPVRNATQEGVA